MQLPHGRIEVSVACPIHRSFRVEQLAAMFDLAIGEQSASRFEVDIPQLGADWRIGLITGPSGSGKSTIARRLFGDAIHEHTPWPRESAVVDGFADAPTKTITRLLTAVGFGSPPSWLKPYHVLSNGERFRCDLARALAGRPEDESTRSDRPLVVFDEFTSVVDRDVARIASAAVARALRAEVSGARFVAVTCHGDVAAWLQPDWTLNMATRSFTRRCLRRPRIDLDLVRATREAWPMFAPHHYLSGSLNPVARCYLAIWGDRPICFAAAVPQIGRKRFWRISRIVTLPDYQGVGVGGAVLDAVASLIGEQGKRVGVTTSHPGMIRHCHAANAWRTTRIRRGSRGGRMFMGHYKASTRTVVSFEYRPSDSAPA